MEPSDTPPSPHALVNPVELGPAVGFAHAVLPAPGRTAYLGGQTAQGEDGRIVSEGLPEQFDVALGNVVTALRAVQASPEHLVSLAVYTTDIATYRARLSELGGIYRRHLGKHYPAMALFGVTELFDPAALVELVGTAVVPDP
ncbi:enamine deaminase RidA (YjgF/YER057c/UK114 family) [Lipingzhangella halophila]|uniref:Enamine deaminase RidA (YjgF/YER057c/UK114 family) n=1 Tax=Lipingzhangella halophila TaxID=1783352 RepID=A0A7W7REM7_9ACTN|nr:Rid family hydrolase [Lipingzhangella halophila]MBB4930504.1 enamine deaminase RidA (YjgF/YER057c/UK114 family) [Lipingzhangella halophila]